MKTHYIDIPNVERHNFSSEYEALMWRKGYIQAIVDHTRNSLPNWVVNKEELVNSVEANFSNTLIVKEHP